MTDLFSIRPWHRAWVAAALVMLALPAAVAAKSAGDSGKLFSKEVQPLLNRYCAACHGPEKRKGDLNFAVFTNAASMVSSPAVWEKVLDNLRSGDMPPVNKPQPSPSERERLMKSIEAMVFAVDCEHPDPGRVTIRRLNRVEYRNTIRDLVGVDFAASGDFPADDIGYGFDTIGDVLSMPPVLLEKYMAAAERVLGRALVTGDRRGGPVERWEAKGLPSVKSNVVENGMVWFKKIGEVGSDFGVAKEGDYFLRVRAFGRQAGSEPVRMEVRLDEELVKQFEVGAVEAEPGIYQAVAHLSKGPHRVSAVFLNPFRDESERKVALRDRKLAVDYLEAEGPLSVQPYPETHRRIFLDLPESIPAMERAARIFRAFVPRAYRRPARDSEVLRLSALARESMSQGETFESAVSLALRAVLVSPHFLFRGEMQPLPDDAAAVHRVDEHALATRLSYFLWSTMPDERLFELARAGKLRRNLDGEIRRMLASGKVSGFVENFAGQWLQLRALEGVAPDPGEFPRFDAELKGSMRRETELLFGHVLGGNRSVLEFLQARYTFVNPRLARHYGLPVPAKDRFERVSLEGTGRVGILGHGSILTLTSQPTRTSPVKRGKWVLENLLGAPPPPPPPDVPEISEQKALSGTFRQKMEQHRANPACASCHARMDPLGFSLENFNGVGEWREMDGGKPIDSRSELATGEKLAGAAELSAVLATRKREEFVRCLTEKLLIYGLGRGLERFDRCAVEEIMKKSGGKDYRFQDLIREVIKSTPFQYRRGDLGKG